MRVIALHAENKPTPGACELYRINQPFFHLNKGKDLQFGWDTMHSVFGEWFMAAQAGIADRVLHDFFSNVDAVVLPRTRVMEDAIEPFVEPFFGAAQHYGVKVIYEVDDDFTNVHRDVISGNFSSIARMCDAVTVTTPFLAKTMEDVIGKPTYVLPNMLDPRLWRDGDIQRNVSDDRVIIWLAGSATHVNDWKVLGGLLPTLLQRHPHALLVICGYYPDYLRDIEGAVYLEGFDYLTYSQLVRQSDIILAPVDPTDGFNMGKSPIKAVEGMGATRKVAGKPAGAAVIATDNPVYRLAVESGHNGLLVAHTPQAWFDGIDRLLTDSQFRNHLQLNAYNSVWKKGHWDISKKWTMWADAYRKIIAQPKRKIKLAPVGEGAIQ